MYAGNVKINVFQAARCQKWERRLRIMYLSMQAAQLWQFLTHFSTRTCWISLEFGGSYLGWAPALPECSTAAGSLRAEPHTVGSWLRAEGWERWPPSGSGPPAGLQLQGCSAGWLSPERRRLCGVSSTNKTVKCKNQRFIHVCQSNNKTQSQQYKSNTVL